MAVRITIIGLGQIGTSIGLALGEHKDRVIRLGHDKEPNIAREAQKKGAVDEIRFNLPSSVKEADVVILALPAHEIRGVLETIALDLREGAVLMETVPMKNTVAQWSKELLPDGRYYVGLLPALNPEYLRETDKGVDAAQADMFKDGFVAICSPQGTPGEAIKLAGDLVKLLGASPLFVDLDEIDGIMTATHILPQVIASTLVNAALAQPGWNDARKFAGRAFYHVSIPAETQEAADSLAELVLQNQANTVRVLNELLETFDYFRDIVNTNDVEALKKFFEQAGVGHENWWNQRFLSKWDVLPEPPSFRSALQRLISGTSRKEK